MYTHIITLKIKEYSVFHLILFYYVDIYVYVYIMVMKAEK